MEERSKDASKILYDIVISDKLRPLMGKSFLTPILKTSIINRKLWNSVYGCTMAFFQYNDGFIWWDLKLTDGILEILNASYITGNPITIYYLDIGEDVNKMKDKVGIKTDKYRDILVVKVEIEKYK